MTTEMKTTALASWYGSGRMVAASVGREFTGCNWVGLGLAGGMSEAAYITARSLAINDRHRHIINLARVAADPILGPKLYRHLRRLPLHPDTLGEAQARCLDREGSAASLFGPIAGEFEALDLPWAVAYFVCAWMGRNGTAGTPSEFTAGMSARWDAGGGDSATRYRSIVSSLVAWRRVLARATFSTLDVFDWLDRVKDAKGIGAYFDTPWPDAGDGYTHAFSESMQRRLAKRLPLFKNARIVIRFGVHPLIEELYPRDRWTWVVQRGRDQNNGIKAEALIINGPSYEQV